VPAAGLLGAIALGCGCSRNPSVLLDPAGPHAQAIGWLFWLFIGVAAVVWVIVVGLLLVLMLRSRARGGIVAPPARPAASTEGRLRLIVGGGVFATFLILTGLIVASFTVDRDLIALDRQPSLDIELTGHQWWWELRYPGATPGETFTTANELHVPVGETIRLRLRSVDVIHSVWLPNIAGKRDVLPGIDRELVFRVDKAGTWRGRCAEFCGLQHAFMGLTLIADDPQAFKAWQEAQRAPAREPRTDEERFGRDVFVSGPCGLCHVIRGTDAAGHSSSAPDLTHLKSRTTIGAGAAPNAKGYLGGWIVDPHAIKPGVHMPTNLQSPREFQALLSYLETLQ